MRRTIICHDFAEIERGRQLMLEALRICREHDDELAHTAALVENRRRHSQTRAWARNLRLGLNPQPRPRR